VNKRRGRIRNANKCGEWWKKLKEVEGERESDATYPLKHKLNCNCYSFLTNSINVLFIREWRSPSESVNCTPFLSHFLSLSLYSLLSFFFKSQTTKWVEHPAVINDTLLQDHGLSRKMNSSLITSTVMEKATGEAFLGKQVFFTRIEVKELKAIY